MTGRRLGAFALLLSCASAPLHAHVSTFDQDCWQSSELDALKVQRFKTMLLVSMLNCRDIAPGITLDYNRFMRANRGLIADKQAIVRAHFTRTHGQAAGLAAYSDYETALGNQFSGADFTPDRCASAAVELHTAGYVSERGLMDMVQSVPDEDAVLCAPDPGVAESRPELAAPPSAPAPQVQDEMAQTEWPDLTPVEAEGPAVAVDPNAVKVAEGAPPPPAAMPEKAAEAQPVQVAAVDAPKQALAPDRVKAVRDAARALRDALAALEADQAEAPK